MFEIIKILKKLENELRDEGAFALMHSNCAQGDPDGETWAHFQNSECSLERANLLKQVLEKLENE